MVNGLIKPMGYNAVVTVGGLQADMAGFDSCAIQRAVECVKSLGGGTVQLSEGTYKILGPIRLYDNIQLIGTGDKTILKKCDGYKTVFVIDADYGELKVEAADASGFVVGMGIQLYDSQHRYGYAVSTAKVTKIENSTVHLDEYLVRDYSAQMQGVISSACSIIEGIDVNNVKISNLLIDGSKESNPEKMDGCRGGAVYLHKAKDCTIEDIKVKDYNGDGFSWQITEDVSLIRCEASGCTNYGAHPGTGSIRSRVEDCSFYENGSDGLFVCWRVQYGLFKNNKLFENGGSGINIGHKDIYNLFESNHIYKNILSGIHMRSENASNAAHYNIYIDNTIEDNGAGQGSGIYINAPVQGIAMNSNIIRDNGQGLQRFAVMLLTSVDGFTLDGNEVTGHVEDIRDCVHG